MDAKSKRKLKEVIRGFIGEGFMGTQAELATKLKDRGFRVTQSTVSRTMNEMGVIKEFSEGQQIYKLRVASKASYRGSLSDLTLSVSNNGSLIVIRTRPGSAMFVAGFLDHECKETILGTIAGDDTIFAAPHKISNIRSATQHVESLLRSL